MMTPFEILCEVSDVTPGSVISRLSSFLPEDVLFIHWAIDDTQEVCSWKNHVRNQRRHFSFGTQLRFQLVSGSITMLQHEWKILHGFPSMIVKDAQLSQRISRPKMNFNKVKIFFKKRTILDWNQLNDNTVGAPSVEAFQSRVWQARD